MTAARTVTAFAPASIGNVGVGFDMLGLALSNVGDRVSARRTAKDGITIARVLGHDGEVHPYLSTDADANTASIAAAALWTAVGAAGGLELVIRKGIPLQSGMGSSAASAVAATVAANALLDAPLATAALLTYAIEGETFASGGRHADNVAPSLLGGLVLCPGVLLPECVRLTTFPDIVSVLIHPHLQIDTASSRRALAREYTMDQWLTQQGYLAACVAACEHQDESLLRKSLHDVIIEPQRAAGVACFSTVKEAALNADAFACSLSGSGPSIFALCNAKRSARVATAMEQACRSHGIECESWISPMDSPGAHIEATT
ncbi:MAG: homoserine kinase [Woeseia sp.]